MLVKKARVGRKQLEFQTRRSHVIRHGIEAETEALENERVALKWIIQARIDGVDYLVFSKATEES